MIRALVAAVAVVAFPIVALADVLEVQPVTDVWAIVGPLEQRSPENISGVQKSK